MSVKAAKWLLWMTFILTVPVPYFMVEVGWVPAVRLFLFAALTAAAAVAEPGFDTGPIAGLFVVQAVAYGAGWWGVARLVSCRLGRLAPRRVRLLVLIAIVAALFVTSLFEIFRTPLSNRGARANLFRIFQ